MKTAISFKVLAITLVIAVTVMAVTGITSYAISKQAIEDEIFRKLTAVREMKAQQVESYFENISNQIRILAQSEGTVQAAKRLVGAQVQIRDGLKFAPPEQAKAYLEGARNSLRSFYLDKYLAQYGRLDQLRAAELAENVDQLLPRTDVGLLMQHALIVDNPYGLGEKNKLTNVRGPNGAPGFRPYQTAHADLHPFFNEYLNTYGYYDLFIIDARQGSIVYSVFKETDYGTSLLDGPHADTNIAELFGKVIASTGYQKLGKPADDPTQRLVDFRPYDPSYGAPAAFVAAPIFDGRQLIAVLIAQMPVDRINQLMTSNESWETVGLGRTGETYLVGGDGLMRNQSRFLIEDKQGFIGQVTENGLAEETIRQIRVHNSTVGLMPVDSEGTRAARAGESGHKIIRDYRGISVLSSFRPLNIPGLDWVIMSEIDESEAFAPLESMKQRFLTTATIILALVIYISFFFSRSLTVPLRRLRAEAGKLAEGDLSTAVELKASDEIGDLAQSFESMRQSLSGVVNDLQAERALLEQRVEERTHELNELLAKQEEQNETLESRNSELLEVQRQLENSGKELEASRKRIDSILHASPDAIIVIDPKGVIVLANQSTTKAFGYTSYELIGHKVNKLMPDAVAVEHDSYLERLEWGREPHLIGKGSREVEARRRDGTVFPADLTLAMADTEGGRLYVGILRDITQRKSMEAEIIAAMERAKEANEAKSAFLANMSHELRTPMNAIIGYAEILREDAEDEENEAIIPDLDKIISAGKHLLSLINDVLDLSKIESGKMELYLEDFAIADTVNEVASTVQSLVAKNNNQLEIVLEDGLGSMHADMTKVRQMLFNLVSNAAKFTHEGTITIDVASRNEARGRRILMRVRDTGIGIPAHKLEHIFEEFTQADDSTTRNYGGTGLGLALVRNFAEMMGGDIHVDSVEGEGSTFTIDLPLHVIDLEQRETTMPEDHDDQSGLSGKSRGELVLVIDDDQQARDLLRRHLEAQGRTVILAGDGEEGIELARNYHPAIITLDVMMPGLDGWAVLSRLKNDPATQDIPVVMVSMVAEEGIGASLGAVGHLRKPVNRDQLKALVDAQCRPESRVLVVEDDVAAREVIRRTLDDAGYKVLEAAHGREALDKVEAHTIDIILLDLMMPVMDGFEFLARLREDARHAEVPVIVVSAKDLTEEDRKRLAQGHVAAILAKEGESVESVLDQIEALIGETVSGSATGSN
jgi:PAS domain S-box-containing protein